MVYEGYLVQKAPFLDAVIESPLKSVLLQTDWLDDANQVDEAGLLPLGEASNLLLFLWLFHGATVHVHQHGKTNIEKDIQTELLT